MHAPSIIRDLNGRKVNSPTVDQVVDKTLETFSDQQLFRALIRRGAIGFAASLDESGNDIEIDDCVVLELDAFKAASARLLDEDGEMRKSILAALEDDANAAAECPCPDCEAIRRDASLSEAMDTIGRLNPGDRGDIAVAVLDAVAAKLEEIATRGEATKH